MKDDTFVEFDSPALAPPNSAEGETQPKPGSVAAPRQAQMPARQINPRDFQIKSNGRNRLMEAAMPLIGLSIRIRSLHEFTDVDPLHARLVNEVQSFQQEIESAGYDDATVLAARYILCAAIDEAVLSRPWGAESNWPERPLLSVYHNETWGGEKVFAILDRVMDEAHRFVDLLELIYYVVALGFEGRYHVLHNGQSRLDSLLGSVHALLEKLRGPEPDRLVNPDPNIYETAQKMRGQFPIWGIAAVAGLLLIGIHIAFDVSLNSKIDSIEEQISTTLSLNVAEEGN